MKRKTYTITGVAALTIPLDHKQNPFYCTVGVEVTSTATYTLYYTLSDVRGGATPVWVAYGSPMNAATASQVVNMNNGPVTAIKVDVTASGGYVLVQVNNPQAN